MQINQSINQSISHLIDGHLTVVQNGEAKFSFSIHFWSLVVAEWFCLHYHLTLCWLHLGMHLFSKLIFITFYFEELQVLNVKEAHIHMWPHTHTHTRARTHMRYKNFKTQEWTNLWIYSLILTTTPFSISSLSHSKWYIVYTLIHDIIL